MTPSSNSLKSMSQSSLSSSSGDSYSKQLKLEAFSTKSDLPTIPTFYAGKITSTLSAGTTCPGFLGLSGAIICSQLAESILLEGDSFGKLTLNSLLV